MPSVGARTLTVPLPGLTPTESYEVAVAALGFDSEAVLLLQMQHFAVRGVIVSNAEALAEVQRLEAIAAEEEETEEEEDEEEAEDEEAEDEEPPIEEEHDTE
jgi:hypothetical protein